jgi:hypothetical protein
MVFVGTFVDVDGITVSTISVFSGVVACPSSGVDVESIGLALLHATSIPIEIKQTKVMIVIFIVALLSCT